MSPIVIFKLELVIEPFAMISYHWNIISILDI